MQIHKKFWAAVFGLLIGLSGAASAADIPVTVTPAAGLAGSTVKPSFSLDVNGFAFASFDLSLTFTDPLLSFDLDSSTVSYNGQSRLLADLPAFFSSASVNGDLHTILFSAFAAEPETLTGPLVLRPAFLIRNGAPLGNTSVTVSGSIGEQPLVGERDFNSSATITVSAVPEPEIWLLWLGGVGLLAWRRSRLQS